jgi:hypothetical protein
MQQRANIKLLLKYHIKYIVYLKRVYVMFSFTKKVVFIILVLMTGSRCHVYGQLEREVLKDYLKNERIVAEMTSFVKTLTQFNDSYLGKKDKNVKKYFEDFRERLLRLQAQAVQNKSDIYINNVDILSEDSIQRIIEISKYPGHAVDAVSDMQANKTALEGQLANLRGDLAKEQADRDAEKKGLEAVLAKEQV